MGLGRRVRSDQVLAGLFILIPDRGLSSGRLDGLAWINVDDAGAHGLSGATKGAELTCPSAPTAPTGPS